MGLVLRFILGFWGRAASSVRWLIIKVGRPWWRGPNGAVRLGFTGSTKGKITRNWFNETGKRYKLFAPILSGVYVVGEVTFIWTAFNWSVDLVGWTLGRVLGVLGFNKENANTIAFWVVLGSVAYLGFKFTSKWIDRQ